MTYLEKVRLAVDDDDWQKFRRSLKGISTEDKLKRLCEYYFAELDQTKHAGMEPCGECDICIRVDNYLKALARGGQLYAGITLERAFDSQFNIGLPIKRN